MALWMGTLVTVQYNPVIRAFSARLLTTGKPKKVAMTACLVILYALLSHHTPWRHDALSFAA
jgi:transposase